MMTHLNSNNKTKNTGFTLIELMVTISIVAILASIAVPSFSKMMKSNRISTGTNELVSALLLARSEALKRSNTVSLCASNDQATCRGATQDDYSQGWLVFLDCNEDGDLDTSGVDCNNDGVTDEADQLIKVHGEIPGINVISNKPLAGEKGFVSYSFSGRSLTRTFNIKAKSDTSDVKQITINLTGRVKTTTL